MLRPKLNRIWGAANNIVRRDPGDEKYLKGWLAEIPTYQVLNYLQWKADVTLLALAERGIFEWGSDVSYKKGACVWNEKDGKIYYATLNSPTQAPGPNQTSWIASSIQVGRAAYDKVVTDINKHIDDVTGNPHKLTPARLNTLSVAEIDALVANYRAQVLAHADDRNNPHKTKAVDIGAVPVTGGTYTGDVNIETGVLGLSSDGKMLVKAENGSVSLRNQNGQVGVDANGKGYVKIGNNSPSEIITQNTFAENKALVEQNYSVPTPLFYMPLKSDINMYIGKGYSDSYDKPTYDSLGSFLIPNNLNTTKVVDVIPNNIAGLTSTTVAVDVMLSRIWDDKTQVYSIGFGSVYGTSGRNRIFICPNGDIVARGKVSAKGTIQSGIVYRIASVVDKTSVKLYINGLLVDQATTDDNGAITSDIPLIDEIQNPSSINLMVPCSVCNLRAWGAVPTGMQISNL